MNSQKRTKYYQYSSYCPDDKDIYDYLIAKASPSEKLLHFLRARGIFIRKNAYGDRDSIVEYISTLAFDWESYEMLTSLIEVRDRSDQITSEKVAYAGSFDDVQAAVKQVEDLRHLRDNEAYRLVSASSNSYTYEIDYIDTENKFSRLMQRRPKVLQVTIEKTDIGLNFRYSNSERGQAVIESIKGVLAEFNGDGENKPLSTTYVSFEGILDPTLRVRFFELFTHNIDGMEFVTVSKVRVDRLPKSLRDQIEEPELCEDDDEAALYLEEQEKIKRAIFNGKDLTSTPEFKRLAEKGFFIASESWTMEDTATREHIHIQAGFLIPDTGTGFEYKIRGKTVFASDGTRTHEKVPPHIANNYYHRIEAAAEKAIDMIRTGRTP